MKQVKTSAPLLETERLRIDDLRPEDAQALFAYRALPEVAHFQGWVPRTPEEAAQFIANIPERFDTPGTWYQLALRHRQSGRLAGDIGTHFLADEPRQIEIGISLAPEYQKQGLASEALRAVLDYQFCERGKHRVRASTDPANRASRRLLEGLGFRQEAHFRQSLFSGGRWVDDVVYAMLRSEWECRG